MAAHAHFITPKPAKKSPHFQTGQIHTCWHWRPHCTPRSVILVHDGYPLDALSASRTPSDVFWSGDVWRLIVLLKKYRPDLRIHTIATAPTGLAVITGLDPASTLLRDQHDRLVDEFMALDYACLDADKAGMLNLHPNDWNALRKLLRAR